MPFTLNFGGFMKSIFFLVAIFGFVAFAVFVGGWAVQYDVNFWASYIQHKPVRVPFFPCAVAGLFLSEISVPVALVTWILSYII
jgi:hypothetical protein